MKDDSILSQFYNMWRPLYIWNEMSMSCSTPVATFYLDCTIKQYTWTRQSVYLSCKSNCSTAQCCCWNIYLRFKLIAKSLLCSYVMWFSPWTGSSPCRQWWIQVRNRVHREMFEYYEKILFYFYYRKIYIYFKCLTGNINCNE